MALFGNLKSEGLEETTDRIGGFQPHETDIYTGPIKMAYAGASSGGAGNVTLILDLNGREYRETIYVTNKKGENFFYNKDDRTKKVALPGFTIIDEICLVATNAPLADQPFEEKMVKVYDFEAKKELPKSVPVAIDLIGKVVSVGIVKTLENKSEKQGADYVPVFETRLVNSIEKVFHTETQMTVPEIRNGAEKAGFWGAWVERNRGETRDKRKLKDGAAPNGSAGRAGRPQAGPPIQGAAAAAGPRKSLFGAKSA